MTLHKIQAQAVLRGGYLNTKVVHMHDQRFSKHTLIAISPLQENYPLNENLTQISKKNYPQKTCLVAFQKWPLKAPSQNPKGPFFSKIRHILTPNRDSCESCLASKTSPFLSFCGHACVQHYYSSAPYPLLGSIGQYQKSVPDQVVHVQKLSKEMHGQD